MPMMPRAGDHTVVAVHGHGQAEDFGRIAIRYDRLGQNFLPSACVVASLRCSLPSRS